MRKKNYIYESEEIENVEIMSLFDYDKSNGMFDNIDTRIVKLCIDNFAFREGMVRFLCDRENMIIYGARDSVARILEDDVWISIGNGKAIGHMGGFVSCEYRIAFIIGYFCREVGLKFDIYPIYSVHKKLKEKLDELGREMGGIELPDTLNQDNDIFDGEIHTYFMHDLSRRYTRKTFPRFNQSLNRITYYSAYTMGYYMLTNDHNWAITNCIRLIRSGSGLYGDVVGALLGYLEPYNAINSNLFCVDINTIAEIYYDNKFEGLYCVPDELIDDLKFVPCDNCDEDYVMIKTYNYYNKNEYFTKVREHVLCDDLN